MSYPDSMISRDINSDEVLFIVVAKSFDRSHAMLAGLLSMGKKSADTIAHLDSGLSPSMKEQLWRLGQEKKYLALIGHLSNNTMGEYKIAELASTLAKDLPRTTKQPIPIVFLGCNPEYIGSNGDIENSAAAFVTELDKQRVNATCFAISPCSIQYRLSDNSLSNQWHTTRLFGDTLGRWTFRGVPECNAAAYDECKKKSGSLSKNLTQLKQQSDSIVKRKKDIENASPIHKTIKECATLKQEQSRLSSSFLSLSQQRAALLTNDNLAQADSIQQVDSTKYALTQLIRPLAELSHPLLHKNEIDCDKISIKSLASRIRLADSIQCKIDETSVNYRANNIKIAELNERMNGMAQELKQQIAPLTERLNKLTEEITQVNKDISDCTNEINQTFVDMLTGDSPMQLITTQYKLSTPKDFPGMPKGGELSNLMIQKPSVETISVRERAQPVDVTPVVGSRKYQPPSKDASLKT